MNKQPFLYVSWCVCGLLAACNAAKYDYPFQNPSLPPNERAWDVVGRLTLEEKAAQMLNETPAIERLGIPPYDWWNECLHGAARTSYKVTVYPQAIAMAATWNAPAIELMGSQTAAEGRAIFNTASAKGDYSRYHGLTYWTPNINIVRDPRWGRAQETYGECPYLTGAMGRAFVNGLQGSHPAVLKAAACAKHYAIHSGPEDVRHRFNVEVSPYDLWDTYLPAFRELVVEAKAAGVMCAYNAFEGAPCCASTTLMTNILRRQWNFTGYVTSDCGAIDDFYREWGHKTHAGAPQAAADALLHSTDLDCGNAAYRALPQAVREGLITEAHLDTALVRLFAIRFRLGMLDPADKRPFAHIDSTTLECPAHKQHALLMARQSIVLLKNQNNLLPLNKEAYKKIAVVGPNADAPITQLGNYNGFPSRIISVLEGIRTEAGSSIEVFYSKAIAHSGKTPPRFAVLDSLRDADLVVFVGGLNQQFEGEDGDGGERRSIALPEVQTNFIKALQAAGKPVVFVMMTGSAIAIPYEAANVPAIINAWYGGEFAGRAVADVLFGRYNPAGRLPVTFYASDHDLPPFEDYAMHSRTYKYFAGKPLYPFGYGLSYAAFEYSWGGRPKPSYRAGETLKCSFVIKNTGSVDGDEVAQAYIRYPDGRRLPLCELRAFERLSIAAGGAAEMRVAIPLASLAKWDIQTNGLAVPAGEYVIFAGGHSADAQVEAKFNIVP